MKITFGEAIKQAQNGSKVAREGWNGKGMFVFWGLPTVQINAPGDGGVSSQDAAHVLGCEYQSTGCLCMKTAQNTIQVGWLASQSDMLSADWIVRQ